MGKHALGSRFVFFYSILSRQIFDCVLSAVTLFAFCGLIVIGMETRPKPPPEPKASAPAGPSVSFSSMQQFPTGHVPPNSTKMSEGLDWVTT